MRTHFPQLPKASKPNILLQIASHVGLQEAQKGSNFVLSPASIQTVLGMVAAGSKGSTLDQILSSLNEDSIEGLNSSCSKLFQHLGDHSNGGLRLFFVNGIWVHQNTPLKPSYEEVVGRVYRAEARAVDFVTNVIFPPVFSVPKMVCYSAN